MTDDANSETAASDDFVEHSSLWKRPEFQRLKSKVLSWRRSANPESSEGHVEQSEQDDQTATNSEGKDAEFTSWKLPGFKPLFSSALVSAIRSIADESDRKEIIAWFIQSRQILEADKPKKETASDLYAIMDGKRVGSLLINTGRATFDSYKSSNLPLSIKAALPVALAGGALFGGQGIGLAAFGGAIGLPVVLILFLGTAGVTAVIEAFVKDSKVRDPLTKLLVAMIALESKRRASKELLRSLREELAVPKRQELPPDQAERLARLRDMDPFDFERHVMSLFESAGHPVGVTSRSNDFGIDGFVTHPDGLIVVQCKRNSADNSVGRPVIQQFKGSWKSRKHFVATL